MGLIAYLRNLLKPQIRQPKEETEIKEFYVGGERHWVEVSVKKSEIPAEVFGNKLTFSQGWVSKEGLLVKRMILRLREKYGDNWKEHIDDARAYPHEGYSWERLQQQLAARDLTLPVAVADHPNDEGHYVIVDGAHTAYVLIENGMSVPIVNHNYVFGYGGKKSMYEHRDLELRK